MLGIAQSARIPTPTIMTLEQLHSLVYASIGLGSWFCGWILLLPPALEAIRPKYLQEATRLILATLITWSGVTTFVSVVAWVVFGYPDAWLTSAVVVAAVIVAGWVFWTAMPQDVEEPHDAAVAIEGRRASILPMAVMAGVALLVVYVLAGK